MKVVFLLALFSVGVFAANVKMESLRSYPPRKWSLIREVRPETVLKFSFGIRHNDSLVQHLSELLAEISDPFSSSYGQHMSIPEIADLLSLADTCDHVMTTLSRYGATNIATTELRDFIAFEMTAAQASSFFQTSFSHYSHTSGFSVVRSNGTHSLPSNIAEHVDIVGGITRLPNIDSFQPRRSTGSNGVHFMSDPDTLRKRYNISDFVGSAPGNKQAVAQFLKQHYSEVDLAEFFTLFGELFHHKWKVDKVSSVWSFPFD
jgi:tripeptidyl-peptidase I